MSTTSQSKPVRLLFAVTASAAVLGTGLPQLTPDPYDWIGAAIGLAGLAISAGVTRWVENRVVPEQNVAARELPSGKVVAGPAADQRDGTSVKVVASSSVHSYPPGEPPAAPSSTPGD